MTRFVVRCRVRAKAGLAALSLFSALTNAEAQSQSELRDRLVTIYMITVSPELCGFPLSESQAAAIGTLSDDLEDQLNIAEEDAQKLYDQIENQMTQQKASGLCDPKGSWAKKFRESVATFTK